jgi:CO/xanthine dehydrogenase Mo-binding subunit
MSKPELIGASLPRLDARAKVTGQAIYTDDLELPSMLHGVLVRSPHPHARIKRIDTSAARAVTGVKAVVVGQDTPKISYGNWRLVPNTQDELPLAVDKVRFVGDEVAAICALDRHTAERAAELVEIDYEPLPTVYDPDASIADGAPVIHDAFPSNVSLERKIEYGDVDGGFARADYLRDDVFEVQAVSHAYLEPCASLAAPDEGGRVTLWTSTQVPYIVQCLLATTLGIPENHVRVIKLNVGGGFGGKMELRPWEFCAAFMALRLGRPVNQSSSSCSIPRTPWPSMLAKPSKGAASSSAG